VARPMRSSGSASIGYCRPMSVWCMDPVARSVSHCRYIDKAIEIASRPEVTGVDSGKMAFTD